MVYGVAVATKYIMSVARGYTFNRLHYNTADVYVPVFAVL